MLIIPAIDIKDGRCVRLLRGDMDRATVYFDNPVDAARHWIAQGAALLHVVDLNGAVEGRPVHLREVEEICRLGAGVQLGGGMRTVAAVETALGLGVARVVVGTAAYDRPDLLRTLCSRFPGRIVVGIDAREGRVAIKGWKETTPMDAVTLAQRCEKEGASRIIYTDIGRDGTREGINVEETLRIAGAVKIPVIASGGVATLEDIRRLGPLGKQGVEGVIVGRALYTRGFELADAIKLAESY
ncbi:MAG TPA: 1-(5-phosphoribosyl)-5-[(5-phosphoribosylamino)methylideneamino]imidazole-4-carboxamide isomerase [candidate division Zixibacteria bacterium]|nr:1-(5-phosphoribosyl)-5-[(5-phosphoribosylamino)methylideneamino]imidazole-4-carboxamide isomerase [candidate division Zixibacteria bacterium]